jgi:hypothetical protein
MPSGVQNPTRLPALPASQLGGGVSYQAQLVVDRQSVPVAGPPGETTLQLPSSPSDGYGYLVERISVTASNGTPVARVYVGSASAQNEMDFTAAGAEDVADENSPIYVPSGSTLTVVWTGGGMTNQVVCTMRVQYAVIRFVPATYGGS